MLVTTKDSGSEIAVSPDVPTCGPATTPPLKEPAGPPATRSGAPVDVPPPSGGEVGDRPGGADVGDVGDVGSGAVVVVDGPDGSVVDVDGQSGSDGGEVVDVDGTVVEVDGDVAHPVVVVVASVVEVVAGADVVVDGTDVVVAGTAVDVVVPDEVVSVVVAVPASSSGVAGRTAAPRPERAEGGAGGDAGPAAHQRRQVGHGAGDRRGDRADGDGRAAGVGRLAGGRPVGHGDRLDELDHPGQVLAGAEVVELDGRLVEGGRGDGLLLVGAEVPVRDDCAGDEGDGDHDDDRRRRRTPGRCGHQWLLSASVGARRAARTAG